MPADLDVAAGDRFAVVDRGLAGGPAVLSVQPVGQQDDDFLVLVAGVLRGNREGRVGQRLPTPGKPDRLVGVAGRRHGVDLAVQRGPVVAQAHDLHRTARILLGGELGAGDRRGVHRVVVLVAIGDAAVPGAVGFPGPDLAVRKAGGLGLVGAVAAGAVDVVPIVPVDPVGGVVARAGVDVLAERDDRDIDVAVDG